MRTGHRLPRVGVARGHKPAMSVEAFLDAVSERTPAPGGGASAAVGCALAAALVEMAGLFGELDDAVARAGALRARALELRDADLEAYLPVLEALRLPREDPERAARLRRSRSPRRRRRWRSWRARWRRRGGRRCAAMRWLARTWPRAPPGRQRDWWRSTSPTRWRTPA